MCCVGAAGDVIVKNSSYMPRWGLDRSSFAVISVAAIGQKRSLESAIGCFAS